MTTKTIANTQGIRDNYGRGKVADFLAEKISDNSVLSVVSAYFTIYAYEALSDRLDRVETLRFLFGEPRFISTLDPEKTDKKSFKIEDEGLELANRLQQKEIARRCAEWIKNKVEIRSIRQTNLLHGKLYHIHDGHREHAILGSSNFTLRGLGLSAIPNIELNLIVDSDRDRADLKAWFDDIWADDKLVADVKDEVLRYLSQLYVNHPPEFIYFKTLFHVFERFLTGQADDAQLFDRTAIVDTDIWKALFDFQKDGAKGAIHKINAHNGCILADSVGLGKTYTALAVIKYHELRNLRVLVLCPKKLRDNWTVYLAQNNSELNPFLKDRFAYTVLSHTDLSRETGKVDGVDLATLNWGNFDLIVIDESHNPTESTYYKAILQNLFFATLNQEMDKRVFRKAGQNFMAHNLYRYRSLMNDPDEVLKLLAGIPFMNGGLFECLDKTLGTREKPTYVRIDGFSDRDDNPLNIPNELFFGEERVVDLSGAYGDNKFKSAKATGLIHILDRYKFTVAENTPIEEEVALDPELLGKAFENLLAAYNPETGATARKQTGSFYTPREIVNYMVDESLIASLKTKLEAAPVGRVSPLGRNPTSNIPAHDDVGLRDEAAIPLFRRGA